ncbi:GPW/gp25 family protein [Teredinibacter franksiae]|jgi:Phage baseplate assembly protein W|uniref:GPW/gp25 family protein n=1 Tax=Teredinibacter franksiae TaxID=2761453 RepID=UPI001C89D6B9|nr:GPW/gp25 family protein [Teredinibacter franksiae]
MTDIIGMHMETGEMLSGVEHIRQSVRDILTTPLGGRVMRRDYGSNLLKLLDRPMNAALVADIQVAVSMALSTFEPRLQLSRVSVELPSQDTELGRLKAAEGQLQIHIEGVVLPEGQYIILSDILAS